MISQTVRKFGDNMCGGRRDQKQIRAIGQINVTRPPVFFFIKETRRHWILGKRLQRQWRDEFGRVVRHDDKNFVALFHEQTG